eukprot:CAMPEP_0198737054 /NCGR_PEP_ID=MMETSP1475-20131203/67673_1 /TAXON_ID= ORGANISM="Unidentified sp., Strain CCMP1999" /NCGR_SAMPLE_ID=MMETSP1475 /ASSEMBLY_ACC=CAM_ASM_001111 /LENGTH=327 /DNA_ID=CAMNT_0044500911 /DNA_START=380 /DNA_END=1363 /DNA_ORIENTATION=+
MFDTKKTNISKAKEFADDWLTKSVQKNKISESEKNAALKRLQACKSLDDFVNVDLVIEAATELLPLKQELFRALDNITKPDVVLASNTSSISITKIASATKRPDKVVGMHFFNPVPVMKVVELISGLATSANSVRAAKEVCEAMGKQVCFAKDFPGFISNRLLMPYINEAVFLLSEGVVSAADIDKLITSVSPKPMGPLATADLIGLDTCLSIMQVLHTEFGDSKYHIDKLITSVSPKPMVSMQADEISSAWMPPAPCLITAFAAQKGPLATADLIGLDTCLSIMQVLHTEFGDSKYRPAPLLASYVAAGWLGRKTGKGFFNYNDTR